MKRYGVESKEAFKEIGVDGVKLARLDVEDRLTKVQVDVLRERPCNIEIYDQDLKPLTRPACR
jgi:hypothetical protein